MLAVIVQDREGAVGMNTTVAADNRFMREVNSAAILDALRVTDSASVSQLANGTGLSRQAVTRSLSVLQDAGLVEFLDAERSSERVGRPAQMVRFRAEVGHVLGVHISPTKIHGVVADMAGTVIGESRSPVEGRDHVTALTACLDEVLSAAQVSADDIWSVSVATPGVVDRATAMIRMVPSIPELVGDVIVTAMRGKFDCPVYLDNDIKLATEGERWEGDHDPGGSMIFVHWGSRVGAGIILEGRLYRGASNDAGDLGFLDVVVPEVHRSDSGTAPGGRGDGLGAFESWVSLQELARLAGVTRASSRGGDPAVEVEQLLAAARDGDESVLHAVNVLAERFARGLAAVRVILDPALIVIGGPMAGLGDVLLERLRSHLDAMPLNMPEVVLSTLGRGAVVSGAIRHSLSAASQDRLPSRP